MDVIVLCIAASVLSVAMIAVAYGAARWRRNNFRFSTRAMLAAFLICGGALLLAVQFVVPALKHRWAVDSRSKAS